MRCGPYDYYNGKDQRHWIPDQVRDDRRGRGFCGVSAPHAEVLLFWQKDPKPWAPGRGPSGVFAPVPKVRAAELAALRQSSPPNKVRDRGAASPAGALEVAPWDGALQLLRHYEILHFVQDDRKG